MKLMPLKARETQKGYMSQFFESVAVPRNLINSNIIDQWRLDYPSALSM